MGEMDATRIAELRALVEAEEMSWGDVAELQSAFEEIDPATLPEPAENAGWGDMLDELATRSGSDLAWVELHDRQHTDDDGMPRGLEARDVAECGTCHRKWCDTCHPAPSARCPFEYEHDDDAQECERCGDYVQTLSSDGLCDGCVAEDYSSVMDAETRRREIHEEIERLQDELRGLDREQGLTE